MVMNARAVVYRVKPSPNCARRGSNRRGERRAPRGWCSRAQRPPVLWPGSQKLTEGHRCKGGARVDSVARCSAEGAQARPDGDEWGVFGEHAQAYLTLLDVSFTRN